MRILLFLLTPMTVSLVGCQPRPDPEPPVPTELSAAPIGVPDPAAPDPFQSAEVKALVAEVTRLNGYESRDRDAPTPMLNLQFRGPGPKDGDLERLRPLLQKSPIPVSLNLNQCESISDSGVAHLAGIQTLQSLSLGGTRVTSDGLKSLAGLKHLESLYLSNNKITDAGLAHLAKLTNLKKLSVYSEGVTDAGYAHLAGLTQLEEIHVGGISNKLGDENLAHLKGMTKLRDLTIGGDKLTDAGMAHLKNLTELRSLRIDGLRITAAGIANLAPLTKLEKLTVLTGPGFTGDGLAALKGMANLGELDLIYTGAPDEKGVAHLGKLTSLKKLRLGGVRDETLGGLAGLKNLEELDLNYSGIGDEGLKHVGTLTGLRYLNLYNTRITDAGLKHLSGLANLRKLHASNNRITDVGIAHLAALSSLEELSVQDCKIAGATLKELAGLTKLKDLGLNGNPLTDAGALELKNLRGLKEVNFTGTKVSEEAALALKKARPDMRIRDIAGDEVALDPRPPIKRPNPPAEDETRTAAAFTLTAEQFAREYEEGKNAAAEKYKGKVIELRGEVASSGRNVSGDSYVTLKLEKSLIGVICVMVDGEPWAKVVPGQKVTIEGKWPETSFGAALIACVFVETGKYQGIPITAVDLAKEYGTDTEATTRKYDKKYLVISGEVEDREFNSAGAATITLKSDGKVKVTCSFTAFEKDVTKKIKVGEKVKFVGEYTLNFGDKSVGLYFCLPLTGP